MESNYTKLGVIESYQYMERDDLTHFHIPEGITTIKERAFYNCKNLKILTFPDSITHIEASAFSGCENIEEIILPKNLKKLSYRAFADCKRLKRIIIPEGVEELEWAVFSGCENLEEIVLPESIKKIDKQLFLNCKKLKKVTLPKSLKSLPDECFKGCKNLDIILDEQITELGNRTFEDCYKLSNYPTNIVKAGKNCFRNCRNFINVTLNENITELSDGMFDGCINLEKINHSGDKPLTIGKRSFRNCKKITSIPEFISNFNEQAFENCIGLNEITIIDKNIPFACFRGCKNISKINNQEYIYNLGSFAFSGCENLEEIDIVYSNIISAEAFSNCKKLKKVRLNLGIQQINSRAFYNCYSLSDINLPESLSIVKKEAFRNCHSIKKITIPSNLKTFEDGAFSYMDSLETIDVSPRNKTFITPDHKILINQMQQKLVLYASGCKDKNYTLRDYVLETDMFEHELIRPLTGIGEYAFAGAKNLEELSVCACTQNIEATAFYGCENLKKLNIEAISLFTCPGFHIREHGQYYFKGNAKTKVYMPFETVTFSGDLVQIFPGALENFTNVKTLNLPNEHRYSISERAFSDCILIEEVNIPKQVNNISKGAFPINTKLTFENGLQPKGLIEVIHNDQYIGDYKLFVLEDGTYYIEQNDEITTLTKKAIDKLCSHSEEIRDNPVLFLDFMNDLFNHDLAIKPLFNGIFFSKMSLKNRKILFKNVKKDDKFFINGLQYSGILDENDIDTEYLLEEENFNFVVDFINILRKYGIEEPILYNKLFMCCYKKENFEKIITYDLPLLLKIIQTSKLFDFDKNLIENSEKGISGYDLTKYILLENTISKFIEYVKKYDIKDSYLIDKPFISICDNPLSDELFKKYDANIKRLLKMSKITDNYLSARQNLNDLLTLLKITGVFEEDPIVRQRASTFISEKMFEELLPNGEKNEYRIIGDDIHRIFNFTNIKDEFDEEFAEFFLENYHELIKQEKQKSGFIQRVYTNFRQISKTCTSNKGSQRKLKVTIEKCKNYLFNVKFDNVTKENQDLAELIGEWFDKNTTWINAQTVYKESLRAPRNIFTKVEVDDLGNDIYDNNPENDLKEEISDNFSYEWLPKQSYDNLVLGKYCSCCAHIEGAGQGIMRASMILDCCQNLVIRNENGEIISKSTIYVNKKEGYAVFNNVETSLNHRDKTELRKIYEAFLRGANDFIKTYNKNNIENPIYNISIGANRNTILDFLTNDKHPETKVQQALCYGAYSIKDSGYGYNGDWETKQKLVISRKKA